MTREGKKMAKMAPEGSVLVLVRGMTLLKDVPVGFASRDVAFNQDIKALVPRPGVSGRFLSYVLTAFKHRLLGLVNVAGHGTGRLDTDLLKDFTFELPSLREQLRIVEMLGAWDETIELLQRLIAAKRDRKRGLMEVLLKGKKRFEEFRGHEWPVRSFGTTFTIEIGGTPARKEPAYWDSDFTTENHWVSIADISNKYLSETSERITDLGVQNSSTKLFPAGTVVMSFKLTIGKAAILHKPMYTNEAICALLPKDVAAVDTEYLYQALSVVNFEKEIDQAVKGRTLNKAKLNRLELFLPSIQEQRRIADVLSTADKEIYLLEKQLEAYELQKRGLMQQLLSGKKRAKVEGVEPMFA